MMSIPETKQLLFKTNKSSKIGVLRWLRFNYLKLLRINTAPSIFAKGIAIGIFIGLTPTIPFHTVLILFLSILCRGHFIAGLLISYLICNPFTMPLIYYASWIVGKSVTFSEIDSNIFSDFLTLIIDLDLKGSIELFKKMGLDFLITLNIGGIIFATPFGLLSYWIALRTYGMYQKKRYDRFKVSVLKK